MKTRRALYSVGGVLLVAYAAAANLPQDATTADVPVRVSHRDAPEAIATEVGVQASRLHDALEHAPVPGSHARNPFMFQERRDLREAPVSALAVAAAVPLLSPPTPTLTLMGIAEEQTAAGSKRTAIVGGDGDTIYMVAEGDAVGDRYRVTKIGADAVELEDQLTKGYRRLALR
jgi:hypothetical protein